MSKRILVIEDNEQNMYLLRCLLEGCGLEIQAYRSGRLCRTTSSTRPVVKPDAAIWRQPLQLRGEIVVIWREY